MMLNRKILLAVMMGLITVNSSASVIVSQDPLSGGDGLISQFDGGQVADNFTLAADVELTGITWWGSYEGSPTGNQDFKVRLFSDVSGSPDTSWFNEYSYNGIGVDSGMDDLFGADIFQYDLSIASLSLTAGSYYISVVHDDIATDVNSLIDWYWLESASGDNWARGIDGQSWNLQLANVDLAYRLTGEVASVPEPATLTLMLLPLGLIMARRFQTKK